MKFKDKFVSCLPGKCYHDYLIIFHNMKAFFLNKIRTIKFESKFASYLLGKCFIVNTCLEVCIIWDNLDHDSWRIHILSYLSTHPWEFIFYIFFDQYKIKRWQKIKFLVNVEKKNYLMKQSHGLFLSYLFVPTWEPTCRKRYATWDNLKR